MNTLLSIIFVLSSFIMFIGLVSPKLIGKIFKKEFTRKKVFFVFGGIAIISMIIGGATSPKSNNSPTNQTSNSQVSNQPTNTPIQKSTKDQLTEIANKIANKQGSVEVEYDEKDKMAILTYSKDEFYKAETVVKTGYTYFVKFGKEAFKLPDVNSIGVTVKTKFTDQYGKGSLEPGVSVDMTKEKFEKYDWDGLKYQSLYDTLKGNADLHYIHPALLKEIDTSKLWVNDSL